MTVPERKVWFTSDTHYSHRNICRGVSRWTDRPAVRDHDTLEEMNSAIVGSVNSVVGQDDTLYHLGDWSFGGVEQVAAFRARIFCRDVHLVLGNHDKHARDPSVAGLFSGVHDYLELKLAGLPPMVLFHYPIEHWKGGGKGSIHLHGHIHSMPASRVTVANRVDVGVDGRRGSRPYAPYSVEEVMELARAIEGGPRQHHEQTSSVLRHRDDGSQPD